MKTIPDNIKRDLCVSFLRRIPEMKIVPLKTYKTAKSVLKILAEKEVENGQTS